MENLYMPSLILMEINMVSIFHLKKFFLSDHDRWWFWGHRCLCRRKPELNLYFGSSSRLPAQESGLLPGDIIQSVDGETMHAKTTTKLSKIRWPAGTTVVLGVFSRHSRDKKQVTLFRRHLEIPIISDELKIIYLSSTFSLSMITRETMWKVCLKNAGKYRAILLDLRNNGGGTLQSSVDVGSLFCLPGRS